MLGEVESPRGTSTDTDNLSVCHQYSLVPEKQQDNLSQIAESKISRFELRMMSNLPFESLRKDSGKCEGRYPEVH